MEISKAKKLKREAQLRIGEILNDLSEETECYVELYVDERPDMSGKITYLPEVTLRLK